MNANRFEIKINIYIRNSRSLFRIKINLYCVQKYNAHRAPVHDSSRTFPRKFQSVAIGRRLYFTVIVIRGSIKITKLNTSLSRVAVLLS